MLVISHDVFNERFGTVLAMAITSQPQRAGSPLILPLGKLGKVSSEQLAQAIDGLNEIVED